MAPSDGERIAPVTYLFGAETSGAPAQRSAVVFVPSSEEPTSSLDLDAAPAVDPRAQRERGSFDPINNVSMYALARRGMSVAEMRDYLAKREFDSAEVEGECERLIGVGLLDDSALAETLVRTLRDRKGLGRSGLVAELRRRKLDPEAIDLALESQDDDELSRAVALAEKRAPQLRSLDSDTAKRRLSAFLMRKGYSGSVVSAAVARALTPSGPAFR